MKDYIFTKPKIKLKNKVKESRENKDGFENYRPQVTCLNDV